MSWFLFRIIFGSFLFWVGIGNIFPYNFFVIVFLLGISNLLFFYIRYFSVFFIYFFFFLGYGWSIFFTHAFVLEQEELIPYTNKSVKIIGESVRHVKNTEKYSSYELCNMVIEEKPVSFCVLWYVPKNLTLQEWDTISFVSKIKLIEDFDGFSLEKYRFIRNIIGTSFISSFTVLESKESFFSLLQEKIGKRIRKIYPPWSSELLLGILIWERTFLSQDLEEDFRNAGLTHILAVSGFNVTILISFLLFLTRTFPRIFRTGIVLFFLWFFVGIVWFEVPVFRATISGFIAYLGYEYGLGKIQIYHVILFCIFIFVLLHPFTLNYDVSFFLSFGAVLGIVLFSNPLQKFFKKAPDVFCIKEALILTISALLGTFPVIIVFFHNFSLYFILSNVLIGWVIPLAMLFGFLSILFSFISFSLALPFAYVAWIFLEYMRKIAHIFGDAEFLMTIDFSLYTYPILFVYIGVMFLGAYVIHERSRIWDIQDTQGEKKFLHSEKKSSLNVGKQKES